MRNIVMNHTCQELVRVTTKNEQFSLLEIGFLFWLLSMKMVTSMKVWNVTFTVLPLLILYLKFEACHLYSPLISTDLLITDTCSEEKPFQQFWVIIIVGQQQIPKIFGKKLVLLDPSNVSCWMFSNVLALLSQFLG